MEHVSPDARHRREPVHPDGIESGVEPRITLEQVLECWPKDPRESAKRLMKEYGRPDEYSESQLIWHGTRDGWKRTVLSSDETPHNFPARHTDFLEQFIDYRVPVEMFTPLAEFDGSVVVNRTKGEVSARCAGTSMNFVAINLANDIVTGKRSVQQAREAYTKLYLAYKKGQHPAYTRSFQFELPRGDTKDPDRPTV